MRRDYERSRRSTRLGKQMRLSSPRRRSPEQLRVEAEKAKKLRGQERIDRWTDRTAWCVGIASIIGGAIISIDGQPGWGTTMSVTGLAMSIVASYQEAGRLHIFNRSTSYRRQISENYNSRNLHLSAGTNHIPDQDNLPTASDVFNYFSPPESGDQE